MVFSISGSVLFLLAFSSVISKVVDFSECRQFFFNGKPPVIPGILENLRSQKAQYKTICQKYGGLYKYATFYDTTNRIPVFSAYKFHEDKKIERPGNEWMVEPEVKHIFYNLYV